jgi:cytochrome bd-type quinol oxidase subunit 2
VPVKVYFIPKTNLGKWSISLIIIFIVLFVIFQILVASGQRGGETFLDNLWLSVPMLLAATSGVMAFLLGLISIIKNKERSALVFVSTIVGFFILWFIVGELLVPH